MNIIRRAASLCLSFAAVLSLALVAGDFFPLAAVAAEPDPLPVPTHYPVDAWVTDIVTPGASGAAARPHPGIEVRNTTTLAGAQGVAMTLQAVVLRSIHWAGAEPDPAQQWTTTRAGTVTQRPDGIVEFKESPAAPGHARFEHGLLLPGERVTIDFPPGAPREGPHELVIEYAVVPATDDWIGDVLLQAKTEGGIETYSPARNAGSDSRQGIGGGRALLRSQLAADAAPLPVRKVTVRLSLPR